MATMWKSSAWVDVAEELDCVVLNIGGEPDLASVPIVEAAIVGAIGSCRAVTLDIAKLTFCDSTGLSMFLATSEKAEANGIRLEISRASPHIRDLFGITGIDSSLTLVD
jgi:anti-sigma B factor antagonist